MAEGPRSSTTGRPPLMTTLDNLRVDRPPGEQNVTGNGSTLLRRRGARRGSRAPCCLPATSGSESRSSYPPIRPHRRSPASSVTGVPPSSPCSFGPSFEEVIAHFGPTDHDVLAWIEENRDLLRKRRRPLDAPLSLADLLVAFREVGTPTGEEGEPYEDLESFAEDASAWGIVQWLTRAAPSVPVLENACSAVRQTSVVWLPLLRTMRPQVAEDLGRILATAADIIRDPGASRAPLEIALATRVGMPPSSPPPPYVGHLCGAVTGLLRAIVSPPGYEALAECLRYALVAPDGSRLVKDVAAAVEGR